MDEDIDKDNFVCLAILPIVPPEELHLAKRYTFRAPEPGYFQRDSLYEGMAENIKKYIRPVDSLTKIIRANKKQFSQNMVGIHLRKTDGGFAEMNWDNIDKEIMKKINGWFEEDSTLKVFLATDCKNTNNKYKQEFGDRLITYQPEYNTDKYRNDAVNVKAAVVDMFLLSACNKLIVGTYGSTFGMCAALLSNNTPLWWLTNSDYTLPESLESIASSQSESSHNVSSKMTAILNQTFYHLISRKIQAVKYSIYIFFIKKYSFAVF